jgi:hypothetical protein
MSTNASWDRNRPGARIAPFAIAMFAPRGLTGGIAPAWNFAQFRLPGGSVRWHTIRYRQRGLQESGRRSGPQWPPTFCAGNALGLWQPIRELSHAAIYFQPHIFLLGALQWIGSERKWATCSIMRTTLLPSS